MSEFKKDEYIVRIGGTSNLGSWPINFVFKQKCTFRSISVYKDSSGDGNGVGTLSFADKSWWRYATPEEAAEYERLGKPFNVTTMPKTPVKPTNQEVLDRYPVGTKYKCAVSGGAAIRTVEKQVFLGFQPNGSYYAAPGNGTLWHPQNGWAEIISKPEQYSMVGHSFSEKTLHEWCKAGDNVYRPDEDRFYKGKGGDFVSQTSRTIRKVEKFRGNNCAWMSACGENFWIRLDGLLEFEHNRINPPKAPIVPENPLITEAKRRYPNGSKVLFSHLTSPTHYMLIDHECEFVMEGLEVRSKVRGDSKSIRMSPSSHSGPNSTDLSRIVYHEGKWSELYEAVPDKPNPAKSKPTPSVQTNEQILEESRRRYPAGTMYKELDSNGKPTGDIEVVAKIPVWISNGNLIDAGIGYIYAEGKWAEIVEGEHIVEKAEIKSIPKSKSSHLINAENLERAKKEYPTGTYHKWMDGDGNMLTHMPPVYTSHVPRMYGNDIAAGSGYIYAKGVWATILEQEAEEDLILVYDEIDFSADEDEDPNWLQPEPVNDLKFPKTKPQLQLHREDNVQKLTINLKSKKKKK